jgi:HSP20 family protein
MSLIRWNPSRELPAFPSDLLSMQRDINRIFDSFFRTGWADDTGLAPSTWSPATDVAENGDSYLVKVELPGVSRDDVKITMQDNLLTIRGEKKQEQETTERGFHRVERSYGTFQRSFTLPSTVKADAVDASFKDGILTVRLPKTEEAKPKVIDVSVK